MHDRPTYQQQPPKTNQDHCGCEENDTATQKWINGERKKYCVEFYAAAGAVYEKEANYTGSARLYKDRKCLYVWTEENYQAYRNLDMTIGTEMTTFNETVKTNIKTYVTMNNTLVATLKDGLLKKLKDVKSKLSDLRDMSDKLRHCIDEDCNATQKGILTGDWSNCKEKPGRTPDRPDACKDAKEIIDELVCMPKALYTDMESIYKAAADVVGIQVFSNIISLDNLQKNFEKGATAFTKHLQEVVKKDEAELKKAQEDLVKAGQTYGKSSLALYGKRSDFEGLFDTVAFFCCPRCKCVHEEKDPCVPRLDECREDICTICEEVKTTFCNEPEPEPAQAR
jgi:hypothetical protein